MISYYAENCDHIGFFSQIGSFAHAVSFPDVSLRKWWARKGKGKRKRDVWQITFFASLSPSLDPSRARPQFPVLRARLLATEVEALEKEAVARA